jgi:site-specific recombinase XerD
MKRPEQLPVVLIREEVGRILKTTVNIKHKALLVTAYSAGLRVGEVVRLKLALSVAEGVSDIDSKRMQIRVMAGKSAKDRYTVLSETALTVLREYFKAEKPQDWLFPGAEPGDHLSERSAEHIFALHACDAAGPPADQESAGQHAVVSDEGRASPCLLNRHETCG